MTTPASQTLPPSPARRVRSGRNAARALCAAFAACGLLAACAGLSPATPEEAVQKRAQARWNALLAGEWEKAYSFSAPSYRALVDFNRYRGRVGNAVGWTDAQVVSVACEAESCTAKIRIGFRPTLRPRGEAMSTHVDEKWMVEDGDWWWSQRP